MKSKVVSLSAISSTFIAIILTAGAYIEFLDLFTAILASAFVILPIYLRSYLGSVLSFLAGGIIAFLFSGFNYLSIVFPVYFGFLGLYPILKCRSEDKKYNKILIYTIGLIWCVFAFYGAYFYYTLIMSGVLDGLPKWIGDYLLVIVGVVAIVFYFIYDRFVVVLRRFLDRYLSRIVK